MKATEKETSDEIAIKNKGLDKPRLTPDDISATIEDIEFFRFPNTTTTVCCMTLKNGFTVVGHSACASPENFNAEIGRKIAADDARSKIWELEGYLLREYLHQQELNPETTPGD